MKAVIRKKEEVAKLTCYAEFDLQGQDVDFIPGQYFFVTLKPDDEEHKDELTHHFSIVNSPNQKSTLALTTRLRLGQSAYKRTLNEAQVGDEVEIGKIAGSFVLPESPDKPVVFIALGIGITPYISMLRYAFEENKDYSFTLIYSDNETQSMPFLDELKQMEKEHPNFKLVPVVTQDENWEGEKRHIDADFLKDYLDDIKNVLYYISGPPSAVTAVSDNLKGANIPEENIKTDNFSGY
jgi:ferredoxin-NADP reductase